MEGVEREGEGTYVVFLDFDREALGVLDGCITRVRTRLNGEVERVLLFL